MIVPSRARIGNYRVIGRAGHGDKSTVFEAIHEVSGRRAAIKILPPECAHDQQTMQRVFNEAWAVSLIQHPGIVAVFDTGLLADGSAYIAMEYVDGERLSVRLQRVGRLAIQPALNLARQVGSILAAVHRKRLVHRILGPDSIMIVRSPARPEGEGERVKILDFGLAQLLTDGLGPGQGEDGQARIIRNAPVAMAPELYRGARDVTGKADVYALGLILYQTLIGHPPFLALRVDELRSRQLHEQPLPLRKLGKNIPDDVDELVQQMLAKDPTERPEMSQVVVRLLELEPARPLGSTSEALIQGTTIEAQATPAQLTEPSAQPAGRSVNPPVPEAPVLPQFSVPVHAPSNRAKSQTGPFAQPARFWPWAVVALVVATSGGILLYHRLAAHAVKDDWAVLPPASDPARSMSGKADVPSRGLKPLEPANHSDTQVTLGRGYAVLFATTRYDDQRWPRLKTPASDAKEIADDLSLLYGFEVQKIDEPSLENIRETIHKLAERKYSDGDQLFFMFSGHGDKDETLKKGWIIARDSKAQNHQNAYPYSELREDIDNIPCRHILLILDVCFGGSFDPSIKDAQTRRKEYQEASPEEFIRRKLRYRSRLYVSSVDQRTEAPEGQGHSPFAWKLLEALRSGGGPDGILTWNELVGHLEKLSPEPRGGVFPRTPNSDPGGDFLFIRKSLVP